MPDTRAIVSRDYLYLTKDMISQCCIVYNVCFQFVVMMDVYLYPRLSFENHHKL